jgi:hypothetical protein
MTKSNEVLTAHLTEDGARAVTELTVTIVIPESLSVAQVARIAARTRYGIRA